MTIESDRARIDEIRADHAECKQEECHLNLENNETAWLLSRLEAALKVVEAEK